ncbi:MAG TPA: prolipoprotein diacylglyceryl transferase family protein [Candidatus Binatia bacterium]|nr:prolipoprotein diacylglyceryl transferase family protein [Candidatus Binatia bacterium]
MKPTILDVRMYPFFLGVAVCVGVGTSLLCARRAGLPLLRWVLLQVCLVLAALVGAKAYSVFQEGQPFPFPPSAISTDGFRYPGGLLATIVALPVLASLFRIRIAELADVVAIPIALAMATVRVGCFLQGCCFGPVSSALVAVRFPANSPPWNEHLIEGLIGVTDPQSLPVHPLQLYFGLWSLVVALVLIWWWPRRRHAGQLFLLLLLLHESGKAGLELLRVPQRADLRLASTAVALLGATALLLVAARGARRPQAVVAQS